MDKKQLYTAISRTKRFEFVHLGHHSPNKVHTVRRMPNLELRNTRHNIMYGNVSIYKVTFEKSDKNSVYIGSTCRPLGERLMEHKSNPKSAVYAQRRNMPTIELLQLYPCNSKKELEEGKAPLHKGGGRRVRR